MENKKTVAKRKKPKFLRTDWHKKIRLGRGVRKNQKWHAAKGRQNKLRLNRKGRMQRPKVGWGAEGNTKGFINGIAAVRVENIAELLKVEKGYGVIVGKVGAKKRVEIIAKAKEMKIEVLNKYKKIEEKENAIR
jgi:large subunit ribosomal protein L32e